METTHAVTTRSLGHLRANGLVRGLGWGLLGGLAGTLVMDLVLMSALKALGLPALLCFTIVGDTVARFLALTGAQAAGGVPAGVVTHYVVGPLFGLLFGALVVRLPFLRAARLGKIMLAAFVYVEVLSQPILATTPILLKMDAPAILQWFVGSFIMHLILSLVLGLVVGSGLRRGSRRQAAPRREPNSAQESGRVGL